MMADSHFKTNLIGRFVARPFFSKSVDGMRYTGGDVSEEVIAHMWHNDHSGEIVSAHFDNEQGRAVYGVLLDHVGQIVEMVPAWFRIDDERTQNEKARSRRRSRA